MLFLVFIARIVFVLLTLGLSSLLQITYCHKSFADWKLPQESSVLDQSQPLDIYIAVKWFYIFRTKAFIKMLEFSSDTLKKVVEGVTLAIWYGLICTKTTLEVAAFAAEATAITLYECCTLASHLCRSGVRLCKWLEDKFVGT
jgi:hypothetical protein